MSIFSDRSSILNIFGRSPQKNKKCAYFDAFFEYNNNINYEELNDKITKFRQYEDLLNTSNEPNLLYEDIKEINEDLGIRVDDHFNIECY